MLSFSTVRSWRRMVRSATCWPLLRHITMRASSCSSVCFKCKMEIEENGKHKGKISYSLLCGVGLSWMDVYIPEAERWSFLAVDSVRPWRQEHRPACFQGEQSAPAADQPRLGAAALSVVMLARSKGSCIIVSILAADSFFGTAQHQRPLCWSSQAHPAFAGASPGSVAFLMPSPHSCCVLVGYLFYAPPPPETWWHRACSPWLQRGEWGWRLELGCSA